MPTPAEIQDAKRLQQMGKAYDRAVYESMGTTPPKPAKVAPPPPAKPAPSAESRALADIEDAKRQAQMDEAYNAAAARSMGTYKEPVKKAKGGTASSRADGCAQRGKTKGRMV